MTKSTERHMLPVLGQLPKGWGMAMFGDLLKDGVRNGLYKPKEFHGRGSKIVNMGELFANPRLAAVPMKRVELTQSEQEKFRLCRGDLLFARRSLVAEGAGACSLVLEVDEETVFESSIIRARPDFSMVDSSFLYYVFRSPFGKFSLGTILRHVAVAGITGRDLIKLSVPLPPLEEQRRIAGVLGALDDKIELNRKMNRTLEDMAQAIFKSWFAFDPITGTSPAGWRSLSLGEACDMFGGDIQTGPFGSQLHASDYVADGIPSVMPKDIKDDRVSVESIARVEESDVMRLSRYCLRAGDIVCSRRGDVERRALVTEREAGWLCGTGCLRIRVNSVFLSSHYMYRYLGLGAVRRWIVRHAQGAIMPNLNTTILRALPLHIPPKPIQDELDGLLVPLFERREHNHTESQTLAAIRDALLPKLISGEIRVPADASLPELAP